jgi:hypothetical protein
MMRDSGSGISYAGDASILFRLLDVQLEVILLSQIVNRQGELEDTKKEGKLCVKTLNFLYLPQGEQRKRWAYNDQVERTLKQNRAKWKTIVPNNGDETDYNNKIVAFCVEVRCQNFFSDSIGIEPKEVQRLLTLTYH